MTELYETETTASRADAATLLRSLADGLDAGCVRLGDDDRGVDVPIPAELDVEVELEGEDEQRLELEVELEWAASSTASSEDAAGSPERTDDDTGQTSASSAQTADSPEQTAESSGQTADPSGQTAASSAQTADSPEQADGSAESSGERSETTLVADEVERAAGVDIVDDPTIGGTADVGDTGTGEPDASREAVPVGPAARRASLARFEVFRDRAEEWRWRLVHRNGNVIATSGEGYTRRHNAEKGLRSVVRNAPGAEVGPDRKSG